MKNLPNQITIPAFFLFLILVKPNIIVKIKYKNIAMDWITYGVYIMDKAPAIKKCPKIIGV